MRERVALQDGREVDVRFSMLGTSLGYERPNIERAHVVATGEAIQPGTPERAEIFRALVARYGRAS